MIKQLKRLTSVVKFGNQYWEYKLDTYTLPDGTAGEYHYVSTPGSVMIIPQAGENEFVLVKQFRVLNNRESLEFPGGGIKPGSSTEENAENELIEEAGYRPGKLTLLGHHNPCNGLTDEICNVFLAENLVKTAGRPDPSEEFEIIIMNMEEIINNINRGVIWDGMTIAAWGMYCFSHWPENY